MESCQTSGTPVSDHFREVTKMVQLGSGAKRSVKDYMLTRYACYLIAQNGDPKKGDCLCTELFCRANQKAGTYRRTYCVYQAHRSPRQTVGIRKAAVGIISRTGYVLFPAFRHDKIKTTILRRENLPEAKADGGFV